MNVLLTLSKGRLYPAFPESPRLLKREKCAKPAIIHRRNYQRKSQKNTPGLGVTSERMNSSESQQSLKLMNGG